MRIRRRPREDAELNITSFMNLMIILVPVLLMSMVFSHVTVLDLTLPELSDEQLEADADLENQQLEVVIHPDRLVVNYPAGVEVRSIEQVDGQYDFTTLSQVLQDVKRLLQNRELEKRDILILSQPNTDYQTLVSVMDTARSYKAVVAASVVDAELFPEIALGDAPINDGGDS